MVDATDTTILLGAGASVDAGVPASFELTNRIVEALRPRNGIYDGGPSQALNVALAAIVAHDTGQGSGAYDGVDVERLFSAVQMLGQRESLEITPFVESWNRNLRALAVRGSVPPRFHDDVQRALARRDKFALENAFEAAVLALTEESSFESVFQTLEGQMINALRRCLTVEPGASDYLAPMFNLRGGPVRVATLNYDRSMELAAASADVRLRTGVELWDGGLAWDWEADADVQLLKLHGSLDWWEGVARVNGRFAAGRISVRDASPDAIIRRGRLAVVFGQRGKLTSNGPFLSMLTGFDAWLRSTSNLFIIGYSFRDDHINELIRRWFNRADDPRIVIVDPQLTSENMQQLSWRGNFLSEVLRITHRQIDAVEWAPVGRHDAVAMGAREALPDLFAN